MLETSDNMILNRIYWPKWNKLKIYLLISVFIYFIFKYLYSRPTEYVPQHLHKYLSIGGNYVCSSSLKTWALHEKVRQLNDAWEVRNWVAFGPVYPETTVLAVRVGRDTERLQYLIVSLAQVDKISSAIIIFSHSFYDERVNKLIESITFCMVMQIYFPNSLQLYPNVFPGDISDCVVSMGENSEHCKERNARLAEVKHHWWWMAHIVFEEVTWAKTHKGMVVFLEEDNYVLPDFMRMLHFAQNALAYIPEAHVLAFGRTLTQNLDFDKLMVDSWRPPYDKGLTFNKTTWIEIKKLTNQFCEYDDASWSYSLLHAFEESQEGRMIMVACMAPRVISTGVFKSGKNALETIYELTRSEDLFPPQVHTVALHGSNGRIYRRFDVPKGNGGWSDLRDQLLCTDPMSYVDNDYGSTTALPTLTSDQIKTLQ